MLRQETDPGQERSGDNQFCERFDHRSGFQRAGVTPHHRVKHQEVRKRNQACGKSQTAMAKLKPKCEKVIQPKIDCDRAKADEHRQMSFVERIEGWSENLVGGISDKSDRITTQSESRLLRGERIEATMFV